MEQSSITGIAVAAVVGCGSLVIGYYLVPKIAAGLGEWKGEALQGGGPHYCDNYGNLKDELASTTSRDKSNVVIHGKISRHSESYKEKMHEGPAKQELSLCVTKGDPHRSYQSYSTYAMTSKTEVIITKESHAVPFTMTDKSKNSIIVKELHSSHGFEQSALELAAKYRQKQRWNDSYILKYGTTISVIGCAKLEGEKVVFYPKQMGEPVESFVSDIKMIKRSNTISFALKVVGISLLVISIIMFIHWVKKLIQRNSEPVQERAQGDKNNNSS